MIGALQPLQQAIDALLDAHTWVARGDREQALAAIEEARARLTNARLEIEGDGE